VGAVAVKKAVRKTPSRKSAAKTASVNESASPELVSEAAAAPRKTTARKTAVRKTASKTASASAEILIQEPTPVSADHAGEASVKPARAPRKPRVAKTVDAAQAEPTETKSSHTETPQAQAFVERGAAEVRVDAAPEAPAAAFVPNDASDSTSFSDSSSPKSRGRKLRTPFRRRRSDAPEAGRSPEEAGAPARVDFVSFDEDARDSVDLGDPVEAEK
jgi:hypothetical protein